MEKYYFDTCIWIDFFEDRIDFNKKPIGKYAEELIRQIITYNHKLIISDINLTEIIPEYKLKLINFIQKYKEFIQIVRFNNYQYSESVKISKNRNIPKNDVLHAIISRDNNLILITRDKHFKKLTDIIIHHLPEDLI